MPSGYEIIQDLVNGFCLAVRSEVHKRIKSIGIDLNDEERHVVLGGLLARQGTLACEFANAVSAWNPHVSPLFTRAMVDVHITLAWILLDPKIRSLQYIEYGLGQAKLQIEHLKSRLEKDGKNPNEDEVIKRAELWINVQKLTFFLSVDVGSWSGKTTREMASETNLLDMYNYVYTPFSSCAHSTWNHVCRMNTKRSESALHRYTFIPDMPEFRPNPEELYFPAQHFDKTLKLLDDKLSLGQFNGGLEEWLDAKFKEIKRKNDKSQKTEGDNEK